MMKKRVLQSAPYLLLLLLLYFPIFGHLSTLPIRVWDEARLAINAYEMYKDGDVIVTHFNGCPDLWNTKPPLLIWFQALFMNLFGLSELAVRLPSAISALLTCIALLLFFTRYMKDKWFAIILVLVLVTSQGYIGDHSTRTGDYDAPLALFTTLSALLFFTYLETKRIKYLYLFFLATALAVLTKSIAGLLFLPGLFLYALLTRSTLGLLKSRHFYYGLLVFAGIVSGYYLTREYYNPGYLAACLENELGGRFLKVTENHKGDFDFYYFNMVDGRLSYWYTLIPCGLVVGLAWKDPRYRRITAFVSLLIATFFLIISISETKITWYDVPLYPFLSVLIALLLFLVFKALKEHPFFNKTLSWNAAPYIFLFVVCMVPYRAILDKTYKPKELSREEDYYELGHYLKQAVKRKIDLDKKYIAYDGYNAHNLFYIYALNEKGIDVAFKDWKALDSLDVVVAQQDNVKRYIEKAYDVEVMGKVKNVTTYKVYGKRDQ